MRPQFEYGVAVRVMRNLRNDGTFPGKDTGNLLIRRGSVGYVRDVGTFLQDQLIYTVDFMQAGCVVGCREQELQLEGDAWVPTKFDFRDKVTPLKVLGLLGEIIASPGDQGEIEKVLSEHAGGPAYHVRFNGRTVLVPEKGLNFFDTNLE